VRSLGHALSGEHLVARSGSLLRRRDILDREHVIGWTFRDTWFQRRAGLTTLDATTAGGHGRVTVLDLPVSDATSLADDALPGLVAQFR
jgi:putative membrane protein